MQHQKGLKIIMGDNLSYHNFLSEDELARTRILVYSQCQFRQGYLEQLSKFLSDEICQLQQLVIFDSKIAPGELEKFVRHLPNESSKIKNKTLSILSFRESSVCKKNPTDAEIETLKNLVDQCKHFSGLALIDLAGTGIPINHLSNIKKGAKVVVNISEDYFKEEWMNGKPMGTHTRYFNLYDKLNAMQNSVREQSKKVKQERKQSLLNDNDGRADIINGEDQESSDSEEKVIPAPRSEFDVKPQTINYNNNSGNVTNVNICSFFVNCCSKPSKEPTRQKNPEYEDLDKPSVELSIKPSKS